MNLTGITARPRRGGMRRAGLTAGAVLLGLAGVALPSSGALAASDGARVALPSPVLSGLSDPVGPAGTDVQVPIRIYLASRAPAAELRFATAASTPGNPGYGEYLNPTQFMTQFGPTAAEAAVVKTWAQSAGLTVTATTAHYVTATGPAPTVSAALDTTIDLYPGPEFAPVTGMSVPASIAADVTTVTGLDDGSPAIPTGTDMARRPESAASIPTASVPASFACSQWWGQHASRIPTADGRTSAPNAVCGYTPQQLRSAYGVSADSGKGATIAIVLDGSLNTMQSDADRFFASQDLPGFSQGQFTVNTGPGFAASCQGQSDLPEEPLDVETVHTIAPQANMVYVAANCSQDPTVQQRNLLDAETRVVDQHLADVSTESFSIEESQFSPATAAAWTGVFEQGAAEGIGFNFDSGDGGDLKAQGDLNALDEGVNAASVTFPASDPWATAVGGTTLEIGRTGAVTGELGWGDNGDEENAAGTGYQEALPGDFEQGSTGGRSTLFAEPGYQRGVVPASLATSEGTLPAGREVPDIAADASPFTGWQIAFTAPGASYGTQIEGGTSGASPIVAGLEADARQSAGHAIGFADPLLYDVRTSAGIRDITDPAAPQLALGADCFNDQVQPNPACLATLGPDTSLDETPGYDDVTGIGGATSRFITALANG